MKNHTLRSDETILFHSEVTLLNEGKRVGEPKPILAELLLTNYYIVISYNKKSLFMTTTETETYEAKSIKIYDDTVQALRNKKRVDVYLQETELFFEFDKEKDAKLFVDKYQKLITGNSKFVRAVKKTQKTINETNDALGIDVVAVAKGTVSLAAEATMAATVISGGKKAKMLGAVIGTMFKKKGGNELSAPKEKTEEKTEELV